MASVEKIINKMKNQPNGIRMSEINKVLEYYGYRLDRQKGSHCNYINKYSRRCNHDKRGITIKSCICKRCFK